MVIIQPSDFFRSKLTEIYASGLDRTDGDSFKAIKIAKFALLIFCSFRHFGKVALMVDRACDSYVWLRMFNLIVGFLICNDRWWLDTSGVHYVSSTTNQFWWYRQMHEYFILMIRQLCWPGLAWPSRGLAWGSGQRAVPPP